MAEDLAAPSPSPAPGAACCAAPDAATLAPCVLCAKTVCAKCAVLVNGKRTCAACRDAVLAEVARETESGSLTAPLGAGLAAAIACGAAWAALAVTTETEIGIAAVGVGWAVGHAVRLAAGGRRGRKLQWAAVACALLGLLLGKYFIAAHYVRLGASRHAPPIELSYFDPRIALIFVSHLTELVSFYDALWIFIAFSAAWRILKPAKLAITDGRGNAAPAA